MRLKNAPDEVDERQIRYLYEVACHGGIRAAADKLGINASVISRQIAQMERELAMPLIERRGRGVALTEIGEHLVGFYRDRQKRQQELAVQLQAFRQLKRGHLAIGVGEGFLDRLMGKALTAFGARYPDIVLELKCGSTADITAMVRDDIVDMGLCTGVNEFDPVLKVKSFRGSPFCAVVSQDHPLAGRHSVTIAELAQQRLIFMPDHFGAQRYLNTLAHAERVHLAASYRCNLFSAARSIAASGLGVAFMSSDASRPLSSTHLLCAVPIDHPMATGLPNQLLCRVGRRLSPAASYLWQQLGQTLAHPL
ncbi:LysR family transcriptional regulator [Paludibacterium yongneupense]|uniref:LysR family transcriptional regulator n=1 Tax=Paludibacterium yongneupense TaxID=400061 RepID=UPI0004080AB2|nr:LysR family transcriptional regulator [Paludibacterium yongneupense]